MAPLTRIFRWIAKQFVPAKRIDLDVPFGQKEEVKRLGARWDARRRVWYITDKLHIEPFLERVPGARAGSRLYLDVPFAEKDAAREIGAKWDQSARRWYVPPGVDPAPFSHWIRKSNAVFDLGID